MTALLPGAAAAASLGVWSNPSNTVHVEAQPCGEFLCGVVVWASDKAKADARKGSSDPLIGSELFKDFHAAGPGQWRGKVYVPDIGKTFSGTITRMSPTTLSGKGCLVGGFGCKAQTWTLVPDPGA